MAFSLYDATVPTFIQMLGGLATVLDKGRAFAAEKGLAEADVMKACLAPDMFPLNVQVGQAVHHALGSLEGVAAGQFSPSMEPVPADFAGLRALIDDAIERLKAVAPAEVNLLEGKDCAFVFREYRLPYKGADFFTSFTLPNFYFHVTTAYDILRHLGVNIGKREYMGATRTSA